MTDVSFSGHEITIDSATLTLRHPIKEHLVRNDTVLVLMEVPEGEVDNTNVIAFDNNGNRLWEIEPSPHGPQTDKPYMSLKEEDDEILVENWNGMVYKLDPSSGNIETHELRRM